MSDHITIEEAAEKVCSTDHEKELFLAVIDQMSADWEEIIDRPTDFRDASTGVGGFIYYEDTERFAKDNMVNILLVLNDFEQETGGPLKKDANNLLNWYAWFALENAISKVMNLQ